MQLPTLHLRRWRALLTLAVLAMWTSVGMALFSNGGFEAGDFTGWTKSTFLNYGLTQPSPFDGNDIVRTAGGTDVSSVVGSPGGGPFSVSVTQTGGVLQVPRFGDYAAVVNYNRTGYNANAIKQQATVQSSDIDPLDGKVHIRLAFAPVLADPGHAPHEQPWFFIAVRNVTRGTTLYENFAYANQPGIAHWNLARFGETLLPLLAEDSDKALAIANEALGTYRARYVDALTGGLRRKLGLLTEEEGDAALAQDLLNAMTGGLADFTLTFRRLGDAAADPAADAEVRSLFGDKPQAFDGWVPRWRERLSRESQDGASRRAAMNAVNPLYIPRNHRVELALAAAAEREDYAPFEELLTVLAKPFEERPEFAAYTEPPPADQRVYRTFCGT